MSKLTKPQIKAHREACALLTQPTLTLDERAFVLNNWQESAQHINSAAGAFFTPSSLARDLSIYVGEGSIIDLCAGIGSLAFHSIDRYAQARSTTPQHIVCVEINPDYVEIGRKIVPEAEWICCDVFDLVGIEDVLGPFDCAIANPPFGRAKNLPLPGVTIDLNVLAIASRLAMSGVFILPQESCPFQYSGRQGYTERESTSYSKFRSVCDVDLMCSSVDCSVHRDVWRGVSPNVEIAYYDLEEQRMEREG